MSNLLEVESLDAGYGRVRVLHGVSLATIGTRGVGLFGPNGHGKTTLLRVISGLQRSTAGRIMFDGRDITRLSPRRIVDMGLIHVTQGNRVFPDMTIRESLMLGAYSSRARPHEEANTDRDVEIFPKLKERWRQRVRTLSGGERQMVSISVALMSHPRLLILDEPTLGLAPLIKDELCAAIKQISEDGVSLVVVEQDVEFLLDLVDHLYLINHGEVAAEIKPGEIMNDETIMEMYFGKNTGALT